MVFNSLTFVLFFAGVLTLHHLPLRWSVKKFNLLVASYLFYAAWNPPFVLLLMFTSVADWLLALAIAREGRPGRRRLLLCFSLAANLGLNLWLAPRYGLPGVAVGTAAANLLVLLAVYFFASRHGFRPDLGTWAVTLLPLALLAGPWAALAAVLLAVFAAVRTTWLFSAADQDELRDAFLHYARKIWPALGR